MFLCKLNSQQNFKLRKNYNSNIILGYKFIQRDKIFVDQIV